METYNTKYGKITLYKNEKWIGSHFRHKGGYWDEDSLLKLKKFIDPNRNILEIGGHCGTSTIIYSSFLNKDSKIFVYEPQKNMYNLLVKNIIQNNLQQQIIPYNVGVFCYEGKGKMNMIDIDGGGGVVAERYNDDIDCNFGGVGLGNDGENINLTMIDKMNLDNIGFIHCDAQGSENFLFSKAKDTIAKYKPVILFENNRGNYHHQQVCKTYPNYRQESLFDIKKYCMETLNYSICIDSFNGSMDTLLIPPFNSINYSFKDQKNINQFK